MKQIRQVMFDEIKQMATNGPTSEEMEKLRNGLINDEVRGRQSAMFRAQRLAEAALYDNDPNLFNTELERMLKITPEQIKSAVAKYLNTEDRAELDVVPAGQQEAGEE